MAKKAFWPAAAAGVGVAAIAATVALTVPASAQVVPGQAVAAAQSTAASSAAAGDTPAKCDRLKKNQDRRHAVETRLQADATTRGSIAWLTAKAASATAAGDTAAAKLFTDKATLRSQVLGPLQAVEADVDAVIKAQCG
jgi:hypothetical protein